MVSKNTKIRAFHRLGSISCSSHSQTAQRNGFLNVSLMSPSFSQSLSVKKSQTNVFFATRFFFNRQNGGDLRSRGGQHQTCWFSQQKNGDFNSCRMMTQIWSSPVPLWESQVLGSHQNYVATLGTHLVLWCLVQRAIYIYICKYDIYICIHVYIYKWI